MESFSHVTKSFEFTSNCPSLYRHKDGFQIMIGWHTLQIRGVNLKTKISHEYGAFIIENNLRRNFLLHLLNLVDHCLLKPSKVPEIMEIIGQGLQNWTLSPSIRSHQSFGRPCGRSEGLERWSKIVNPDERQR